ncbi:ABC transporter permease [Micromonospora peucetia]|uniref:Transport permease protein n=1 Tax=Micromonospora peucetia TaxID=47871 RepID=A0A1C6W673_9ACTN|nr:ABC transporter permease [Micromonospora peucetia]MCX4385629.1 ABC transporter permease [Micromonospora peucetia]WSA33008.1 ABC transporter permease [Micromonospora peucetia]SCL74026.1 teichoic acid transport system permease protein [Micromonospora peucetia]
MAHTAVADPDSGLTQAQLAERYGLSFAGARPTLAAYARQLWSYRHFIAAYANAKVVASFSTARLGRLWQVLTPLTNAAVYFFIFGVILNTKGGIDNFIAYLCVGLFVFNFTSAAASGGVQAISGNLGLVRALHFPRAALPLAVTLTQLQHLVTAMVVLIGIVLATGEPITVEWLLLIPAVALQSIFNAGLALGMARLGAKLTDLRQLMPFVLRTWMYGSGVLYSIDKFAENLPSPVLVEIVHANPLLIYIELIRHALMEDVPLTSSAPQLWAMAAIWAVVIGVGGFVYFWRGEQEYGRG